MASEWKQTPIIECIELIGGGTPKTSVAEYWDGDIPWLSVKDFNNDYRHVYTTEKCITEAGLNNSSTKLLRKDDIIISARGTVGEMAMIPYPMAFNQSCYGIRAKDSVNSTFLYYLLKNSINKLKLMTHGSVFDTITRDTFASLIVGVPDRTTQDAIASMLAAIDDKIELNNKINDNLRQQAQAIYTSMFLTNADPSWPQGHLSDLIIVKYGKDHKKLSDGIYPVFGSGGIMRYVERPLYTGESVLIPRKGTLNNVMYVNEPFWSVDTMFYIVRRNRTRKFKQVVSMTEKSRLKTGISPCFRRDFRQQNANDPFDFKEDTEMSKTYGYARCSTSEDKQDINRQIRELKAAGADEIVFEYEHGDAVVNQQLQSLLDAAEEGDTIITLEVSRLTRSTQQLCEIVNVIKQKRLRLVIVGSITVDCRTGQIDPIFKAGNVIKVEELMPEKTTYTQLAIAPTEDTFLATVYDQTQLPQTGAMDTLLEEAAELISTEVAHYIQHTPGHTVTTEQAHQIVETVKQRVAGDRDLGDVFRENELPLAAWMLRCLIVCFIYPLCHRGPTFLPFFAFPQSPPS